MNESPEDSYLITRTSEQSTSEEDSPQIVTAIIPSSCRNLLSSLSTYVCMKDEAFAISLEWPDAKGPKHHGNLTCTHYQPIPLGGVAHNPLVSTVQIICFISNLRNTVHKLHLFPKYIGRTQTGEATLLYQEKVRKHAEEIQALHNLMKQISAKIQEVKVMSNEDLVAQNIMKKIQGDYIEKPDFALKSIGGTIDFEHTSATYSCDKARSYWSWLRLWNYAHPPDVILEPNVTPGNCWAFRGDRGQVVIRLARKIFLTNITIQHIPKTISLSGNLDTAPKDFVVYGISDQSREETFLGAFMFQPENAIQMFPLQNTLSRPFNCIKLKILTNWGNPHFTCIYRVRAHGTVTPSASDY
ncbi:SUN domain-containing protein 5 [Sarcophilus harrisii]